MATANNSMIDVQGATCARIPDVDDSDGDGNVTELVDDRDFDTRICRNWNDRPDFSEFIFFSHGENGAGTYNSAGVLIPEACNSAIGSVSPKIATMMRRFLQKHFWHIHRRHLETLTIN